jgi:hypothetical protein
MAQPIFEIKDLVSHNTAVVGWSDGPIFEDKTSLPIESVPSRKFSKLIRELRNLLSSKVECSRSDR